MADETALCALASELTAPWWETPFAKIVNNKALSSLQMLCFVGAGLKHDKIWCKLIQCWYSYVLLFATFEGGWRGVDPEHGPSETWSHTKLSLFFGHITLHTDGIPKRFSCWNEIVLDGNNPTWQFFVMPWQWMMKCLGAVSDREFCWISLITSDGHD